jgi:Protein of unknown function (DUF4245)
MSAASGQPGRYQRSSSGMVGALLATLLVIAAFVALRACNRTDLQVEPDHVDYLAQVGFAQQAGDHVVYPASLPSGWYATQLTVDPGRPTELQLSMLTGENDYVGFVQSPDSAPVLLTRYVDASPVSGDPADVPGAVDGAVTRWDVWTDDGGDTALVAERGDETLMVFGTASRTQLEQLAGSLTTARL